MRICPYHRNLLFGLISCSYLHIFVQLKWALNAINKFRCCDRAGSVCKQVLWKVVISTKVNISVCYTSATNQFFKDPYYPLFFAEFGSSREWSRERRRQDAYAPSTRMKQSLKESFVIQRFLCRIFPLFFLIALPRQRFRRCDLLAIPSPTVLIAFLVIPGRTRLFQMFFRRKFLGATSTI